MIMKLRAFVCISMLALVLQVYSETRYIDCRDLMIANHPYMAGPLLSRLDVTRYRSLPEIVNTYAGYSTGLAILFSTDSPYIKAQWSTKYSSEGKNTSPLLQSGLDLYILRDSVWIHAGVGLPSDSLTHFDTLVDNMEPGMKNCILYLPLWNTLESLKVGVADSAECIPYDHKFNKRIAIVGSSITHGAAASRPGLAYPAQLQRTLNAECINLGFSGQCKLDDFYTDFLNDTDADIYVIDAFSNPSPQQIEARLRPFVDRIRLSRPNVPIVFIQTEIRETGNFDLKKREYENSKRLAAENGIRELIENDYHDIYFINPGMPLGDTHERTVDGTHPSDAGFELIIENLVTNLKPYL